MDVASKNFCLIFSFFNFNDLNNFLNLDFSSPSRPNFKIRKKSLPNGDGPPFLITNTFFELMFFELTISTLTVIETKAWKIFPT